MISLRVEQASAIARLELETTSGVCAALGTISQMLILVLWTSLNVLVLLKRVLSLSWLLRVEARPDVGIWRMVRDCSIDSSGW